jgi:hypothetical protein
MQVASNSFLNFNNYAFSGITTMTGGGTVSLGGSTTTINGTLAAPNLQLVAGMLSGTNVLSGMLTWSGGAMSGTMTIATNSVLNIVAGGGNGFYGLVFTNYGTVNWGNATIYGQANTNAQIYNYGLWNAQSDNTFVGGNAGGTTLFDNFGRFLKSGNGGTTTLDANVVFNNTGTVTAASGTLTINGGGTNSGSGTFGTTGSGLLDLNNITFANSTTFSGSEPVALGGSTTLNGVMTASNLQLVGGMLSGTNVLSGTLTWSGGAMSGTMTIATNSVLNIVAGGGNGFYGLVLTNHGTVNWSNTTIYGQADTNAQIYNYGLWNAQSDNTFVGGNEGGTTLFDNFGTFLKSGNSGTTTLDAAVVFNNTGTVNVESGTLDLNGPDLNNGGGFTTASGGFINFYNFIFTNSTTFTGVGGYLAGSANFGGTIAGTLTWAAGNLSGVMTLASNGVFNIVAGGGNGFYGFILTNYGTVNWTNTTIYGQADANAQIYNYGLWNAQSDNTFAGGNAGGTTLFDNFGTFLKSGNGGTTTLDVNVVFNNTGTVTAASGTLTINGGANSGSGTFAMTGSGLLGFDNYTFANNATITGGGTVSLGGATTTINGTLTASNLQLTAGALGGTNVLVGTLTWSGGTMAGTMTIATNSVFNIVAGGGNGFYGFVLTNYGTVNWGNTTIYGQADTNAQIYNYGLWNAQSDNTFVGGNAGGTTLFDNFGTFRKSGTTGTTTLNASVVFNNTGTFDAQSGTLSLNGSYNLTGGTLNFGISSLTSFGQIDLAGNPAPLTGTLSANLNDNYVPLAGNAFQVLNFTSSSGVFTRTNLPLAAVWQTTYHPANVTISVLQLVPAPVLQIAASLPNVVISWTTNSSGYLLNSTHSLAQPISWSLVTNNIVVSGSSKTVTIDADNGPQFFQLIGAQ